MAGGLVVSDFRLGVVNEDRQQLGNSYERKFSTKLSYGLW